MAGRRLQRSSCIPWCPRSPVITPITETVAIFRDVPANLDILIRNTPDTSSVEGLQVGMKHEPGTLFEGLKVGGMLPMSAVLTETTFIAETIAENPAARVTSDFDCELMTGSPPQIGTPEFTPRGNYGELEFPDVTHAFNYEWTFDGADDAEWNIFDENRPLINPGAVEITPGDLNVTVKFPNIDLASGYAYMLESDSHTVPWTAFTGILANGMITIIIPNLEDGATYTLRLRVASPWIGTPIELTVSGGRLAYCVHDDGADSYLYIFHTGVADAGTAIRIKRILLPTGNTEPRGVAIHGDLAYVSNGDTSDDSIYVFNHANTVDGARAAIVSKFLENTTDSGTHRTIAVLKMNCI